MKMNLEYLRIFFCAAQCGSLTRAAQQLMSSQPNVTRALNRLEDQLECRLFVRGHHGVKLTPEGETLFAHVRIAFEHIESAERELDLRKELQSGTVSVGATEVALRCFLLPILRQFRERYPNIHIRVQNHSTPQAVSSLCDGFSDLAIVTTPVELPNDCTSTSVMRIQETAVCGAGFSHLLNREVTLSEINQCPVICLNKQTKTYALYRLWFQQHGLTLSPSIEAATADQILPLVRSGLGIGFVPESFLQDESECTGIDRISLKEPVPTRFISLVKHKNRSLSIAAAALERTILAFQSQIPQG